MDLRKLLDRDTIGIYGKVLDCRKMNNPYRSYLDHPLCDAEQRISVDTEDNILSFMMQDDTPSGKDNCRVDALLYAAIELIVDLYNDDPSPNYTMAINRIEIAIKMLESKDGRR